jgi:hypothetical protein
VVKVDGCVYSTLVDTGAEVSFADARLVTSWCVPIVPPQQGGKIRLAHADIFTDRSGSAELDVTALFPSSDRTAITIRSVFELMPINGGGNDYHFIIGRDLIRVLFPEGLPLCNEVWPHFLTDASLKQLIRGREGKRRKRREEETLTQEERRVRAWETLGARRWARSRSSSGRRREHFGNSSRALPQERGEDREQFPKKGIVATQSASHISRRTAYDHVHSFSERPDRT